MSNPILISRSSSIPTDLGNPFSTRRQPQLPIPGAGSAPDRSQSFVVQRTRTPGAPLMVGSLPPSWMEDIPALQLPPQAADRLFNDALDQHHAGLGSLSESYRLASRRWGEGLATSCPAVMWGAHMAGAGLSGTPEARQHKHLYLGASKNVGNGESIGATLGLSACPIFEAPAEDEDHSDLQYMGMISDRDRGHSGTTTGSGEHPGGTPRSLTALSVMEAMSMESSRLSGVEYEAHSSSNGEGGSSVDQYDLHAEAVRDVILESKDCDEHEHEDERALSENVFQMEDLVL